MKKYIIRTNDWMLEAMALSITGNKNRSSVMIFFIFENIQIYDYETNMFAY